ncbi:MAG: hypothetical protein JWN31_313 [Frankiales bacterium]|nr:hypothetical protein [Frankiales bacterium]
MTPDVTAVGAHRSRGERAFRARVRWGDQLIAESAAAVKLELPRQPPALCFPIADVRMDLLRDEGRTTEHAELGSAQLWSLDGEVPTGGLARWSAEDVPAVFGGADAARRFAAPPAELAWLSDTITFDHDRVRVELVNTDDPRAEQVTRFPAWGDVDDLVAVMDVQPSGDNAYVSVAHAADGRPVVEGSQLLGQAIVAAGRHAPGRRVVSAHMVFFRGADARLPLEFQLDVLSAGRTFTTLGVTVVQEGRPRAAGTLLLDVTAPDLIRHQDPAPPSAGPYDSPAYDMGVIGRDLRIVDAAYTDDPLAPVGPPVIDAWLRLRGVPADDPPLHAGLLAQFTGHMSIAAALRPHEGIGQAAAHRTISTGINAITLALHRDVRMDEWVRYHHRSIFAGDGMSQSECRVYDEAGELVASFTVAAMLRGFAGAGAVDARTVI